VGLDSQGLPIGFQVMAPALGEATLLQVASEVERLADFSARATLATSQTELP
jgi:Asp-tRNA(Asn)/Glu-tRNA(Gln) amidotransferase A subunit family amidase